MNGLRISKLILVLLCSLMATTLTACPDDDGGGSGGSSLKSGQTAIDLTFGGGDTLETTRIQFVTDDTHYMLLNGILLSNSNAMRDLQEKPTAYEPYLATIILSLNDMKSPGTYSLDDSSVTFVVGHLFEPKDDSDNEHSLDPHPGSTVEIVSVSEDGVEMKFDMDMSPTQIESTDLVVHVKGTIKHKD